MDTPWKVVGFEKFLNDRDEECVRLYVARPLVLEDGHVGDGLEVNRFFYKPQYVKYEPQCGHMIITVDGRYGIAQIYVVGTDSGK